ncbi:Putative FAD/NAD(P)-binding domain, FAD/NAD(P)-binding domain superfamily [Septoria linicola]|uniref:FAD/NAD(P)-binding domain, FAD/NAD(P)-binding domain superfamily n=1 Tax=Septoria linicola TaxID=215465 RepID=A0A9Q9ARF8_9PEZI|nr:putative FAD/NAD(P)-binding domain, FAD/NAD(P)-binding domain superfamily [Septoria linicola]USW53199.1 Putative FAD/NAD(P)-binding domain, FAD/NAD(P)-binding domain superfamily [Septoria linicola]
MGATRTERIGANVPAPDGNGPAQPNDFDYVQKYALERDKRLGRGGVAQYIDPKKSEKHKHLLDDPWIAAGTPVQQVVPNGGHCKVLIVGAGYGGILFAVELIKKGFQAEDIMFVDPAGGFGGTWYWNRYPGLMCDVESYIYMPMLEEMGYMPKHKYASGEELRLYAENICEKYELHKSAMFQSTVQSTGWDEDQKRWKLHILQEPKGGSKSNIDISADFVILANGLLNNAKVPNTEGSDQFKGEMFHTARWNYDVTGGSSADPAMTKLEDKKVAIIGTGATAIQVIPQLAKWSKQLYVFQRTPSAVDIRNNRETEANTWKTQIATGPGWQKARNLNYFHFVSNADPRPKADLVDDGWTHSPAFSALVGNPSYDVTMEKIGDHVARLNALDLARAERVRARVAQVVEDPDTAKSLQAYYPVWCKRPCFHDEYLPSFNRPNVKLIDTDGRGVNHVTRHGVEFDGIEYEADILVWSTGFSSPGIGTAASRAGIELKGRNGKSLDEHCQSGMSTLHGVTSREFPNLFWPGPFQTGASPNQMYLLTLLSAHVAYIISEAGKRVNGTPLIQPTKEGEEAWAMRCMAGAGTFAAISGCTPGYINKEGESDLASMEEKMKSARLSPWSRGIGDFTRVIEEWQADGKLDGLEVVAQA